LSAGSPANALASLRGSMRKHHFPAAAGESCNFRRLVDKFDSRSRREGLHVLEGWDYREHKFPEDIAAVLLVDYCARLGIPEDHMRTALAILLDQYFLSLLTLLSVRIWDDGDANRNLERVTSLVEDLHAGGGGGLRLVDDADTLLILAIAYYNPEEASFGLLMGKVRTLNNEHQLRIAIPFAGVLGSHLRWGLRFMYGRDIGAMREDNVVDYPMLLFAQLTLMREYARLCANREYGTARDVAVEALLNGFAADPWAFTGKIPACLSDCVAEYDDCRRLIEEHRSELLNDFAAHEPRAGVYSPLAFSCNFLSNAAVAAVAIAVGGGEAAKQASLNALFSRARMRDGAAPEELAERLMEFSSSSPERLGWRGAPLIVHDFRDAVHWYNTVRRTISDF
jgi:hypothetical protein